MAVFHTLAGSHLRGEEDHQLFTLLAGGVRMSSYVWHTEWKIKGCWRVSPLCAFHYRPCAWKMLVKHF